MTKKAIGSVLFLLSSALWFAFNMINGVNGIFERVLKISVLRHTFLFEESTIPVLLCFFIFTVVSLVFAIVIKYKPLLFANIILFVFIIVSYLTITLALNFFILKIVAIAIVLLIAWYAYTALATRADRMKK